MKIKNQRDFFSGLLFMACGGAASWVAATFRIGNAAHMGQGYFPLMLGVALALLGGFVAFKSLVVETEDGGLVGGWAVRPLVCVVGATVLFGLMLGGVPRLGVPPLGLLPAVTTATLVAALASDGFRLRQALLLGVACAVTAWLVLVRVLEVAVPLWPAIAAR